MAFPSPRVCFISILILLAIVSSTSVALKNTTLTFLSANSFDRTVFNPYDEQRYQPLDLLPLYIYGSAAQLAIASGAISLALAVPGIIFAFCVWPDGKRTYPIAPNHLWSQALLFNACFALAALIYILAIHSQSAHFDPDYKAQNGIYDQGTFDVETWTCELAAYTGAQDVHDIFSGQCPLETAGRGMFVVLCLVAFAAAGTAFWATGKEKQRVRQGIEARRRSWEYWNSHGW